MKRLSSIWQQLQDTSVYFPPPLCPKEVKARVLFFPVYDMTPAWLKKVTAETLKRVKPWAIM
jgi:hypothetical protein